MTTSTRHYRDPRELARETQRSLPRLDTARIPPGLEAVGEPWVTLAVERSRLLNDALHARTAAERADREVLSARERDDQAFEQAALTSGKDPGRKHEAAALKAQDEAHRIAVGATRASNTAIREIRKTIDGAAGDDAMAKVNAQIDADLERLRESADATLGELGTALTRVALLGSIEATRRADHVTVRAKVPTPPEGERFLRALLDFDPRGER